VAENIFIFSMSFAFGSWRSWLTANGAALRRARQKKGVSVGAAFLLYGGEVAASAYVHSKEKK
jgi:hypothetical protein